MNKKRRDLLQSAIPFLTQAANIIDRAAEQESDCLDNAKECISEAII